MKKIFILTLLFTLLLNNTKAQFKNTISMQLSVKQIELNCERKIFNNKWGAELTLGIGNQDINNKFDDLTSRLGIVFFAFANSKNQISINTGVGIYHPTNDYYTIIVPLTFIGARYTRFLGKKDKHEIFVNTAYLYGKRNYIQTYSSELFDISTIGTFKVSPWYIAVGYGFRF